MKGWYRTSFADGSAVDGEHENASDAKIAAQNTRIRELDPAGRMDRADLKVHPRVKVASVRELTADERAAKFADATSSGSSGPGFGG